jgi:hypothetical protein
VTARRLWPGLAALPAVRAAHIGVLYVLQSLHCLDGVLPGEVLGVPLIRLASVAVTAAAGAFAVVMALRLRALHRDAEDEATAYVGLGGSVVAALLGVYLVWSLVPAVLYPTCPA